MRLKLVQVQSTLSAMEVSGFHGLLLPSEEDLDIPFFDHQGIRTFFGDPANVYVLARYVARRIGRFDQTSYPRLLTEILLDPAYKSVVYWPAVSGR